jgi:hypothetical protein
MHAPFGFERLPDPIVVAFDGLVAEAALAASLLGQGLDGSKSATVEIAELRERNRRALAQLRIEVRESLRLGPDRSALIEAGRAVELVSEALEDLLIAWSRSPDPRLDEVLRQLRDLIRQVFRTPAEGASADPLALGREQRLHLRSVRAATVLQEDDPTRAMTSLRIADCAERVIAASRTAALSLAASGSSFTGSPSSRRS